MEAGEFIVKELVPIYSGGIGISSLSYGAWEQISSGIRFCEV